MTMFRSRRLVPLLSLLALAASVVPAHRLSAQPPAVAGPAVSGTIVSVDAGLSATESAIVARTNDERARRGLAPLSADPSLMNGARRQASWMARSRTLAHGRGVTENIGMGQGTAGEAVGDWMRSDGHRANILGRNHSRIGVAVARAADGTLYWCQQFR